VALRGSGQLTVVLGVFHNAVLGKWVSLGITLWATQEAGQPNRFYSLAETDQSIAADFSNFGQDPLKLKKKLRAAGASVHDTFEPYAAAFKRQFGISGNQAMELFHRTVSMKQVENITSFVRTNMLEEDDVATRITNLIHHFDDLKKAHDAVLRAKDQIALLTPIKEGAALHAALTADDELARRQRDQLHPWFTDRKLQLSLEHQGELERTGVRLQEDSARLNGEIKQLRRDLAGAEEDIRTNGGGRLAAIDADRTPWPASPPSSGSGSRPTRPPQRTLACRRRRTVSSSTRTGPGSPRWNRTWRPGPTRCMRTAPRCPSSRQGSRPGPRRSKPSSPACRPGAT
jgi:uncharacterized protein YPO0396